MRLFQVTNSSLTSPLGTYTGFHLPNPPLPRLPHGFGSTDYFTNTPLFRITIDCALVAYGEDRNADVVAYYGPSPPPTVWNPSVVGSEFEITHSDANDFVPGYALFVILNVNSNGNILGLTAYEIEILGINPPNNIRIRIVKYLDSIDPNPTSPCVPSKITNGILPPIYYNSTQNIFGIAQNLSCILNEPITEIRRTDFPVGDTSELTGQDYDIVHVGGVLTSRVSTNSGGFLLTTNFDTLGNLDINTSRYEILPNHLYTHRLTDYSTCNVYNTLHTENLRVRFRPVKRFSDNLTFELQSKYPNTYGPQGFNFCWPDRPSLSISGNSYVLNYNGTAISTTDARAFIFILQDPDIYTDPGWNANAFEISVLIREMTLVFNTGTTAQWTLSPLYPATFLQNFINPQIIGVIFFTDPSSSAQVAIYSNPISPLPAEFFDEVIIHRVNDGVCVRPQDSIVVSGLIDLFNRGLNYADFDRDGIVRITLQMAPANSGNFIDVETYSARCSNVYIDTLPVGSWPREVYYGKYSQVSYPSVSTTVDYPITNPDTGRLSLVDPINIPVGAPARGTAHGVWPERDVSNYFTLYSFNTLTTFPLNAFVVSAHFRVRRFLNPSNFYQLFSQSFNRIADANYTLSIGPGFDIRYKIEYISSRNYFVGYSGVNRRINFRDYQPYTGTVLSNTQSQLVLTPPAGFVPPNSRNNFIFTLHARDIDQYPLAAVYYAHTPLGYGNIYNISLVGNIQDNIPPLPTPPIQQYTTPLLVYNPTTNQITVNKNNLPPGTYYLYLVGTTLDGGIVQQCSYNEILEFNVEEAGSTPQINITGDCCPYFYYVQGETTDIITFDSAASTIPIFTEAEGYYYATEVAVENLQSICRELSDFCPAVVVESYDRLLDIGLVEIEAVFENRILAQGFRYINLRELVRHQGHMKPNAIQYDQIDYETITQRDKKLVQRTFEYEFLVEIICNSSCQFNNVYKLLHAQYWRVRNLKSRDQTEVFGIIKGVEIDSAEYPYQVVFRITMRRINRPNEARYPYPQ